MNILIIVGAASSLADLAYIISESKVVCETYSVVNGLKSTFTHCFKVLPAASAIACACNSASLYAFASIFLLHSFASFTPKLIFSDYYLLFSDF